MILSYNKLKEMGIKLDIDILSQKLFQLGHEVEEVENLNIDNLVIGEILEVKKHPEADKLNICKVNIKEDTLQIVCGAKNVQEGQKVIVAKIGAILNGMEIKPVKLKGIDSNGMICSLEELGYTKDKLNEEDYEGIHVISQDVKVGDNPMEVLGLGDQLMDIFLTSNRGDCQSYKGIYNDLASLLNYEGSNLEKENLNDIKQQYKETLINQYFLKVDENQSEYFSHFYIQNVNVKKSDWETKLFLLKQNIKSQNSLTDISNEALMNTGIPSHIYDADKIKGGLNLLTLTSEEEFTGLDEKTSTLPKGTLVIKDEEKIVAIAGVMGSNETKVSANTKNILVEVASFNAKSIFNSSKIIGKKTEAALRYEKEIDVEILNKVSTNIINKIVANNPSCEVSNAVVHKLNIKQNKPIKLKYDTANKIIGINIDKNKVDLILKCLDFKVEKNDNDSLLAIAPTYRKDQAIENDLIEEIIRIYNIDNIEIDGKMSSFLTTDKVITDNKYDLTKDLEHLLLIHNLNQVITYSLINEDQANQFNKQSKNSVELMSPLSKEHQYYRQSLLPSLLNVCKENYSYQEKEVKIFEIANTYKEDEQNSIVSDTKLAILVSGDYQNYYKGAKRKFDFFDLKGILEDIFNTFNLSYTVKKSTQNIAQLNPYASADIIMEDQVVGVIGEVVYDYYKKMPEKVYVLEISIKKVFEIFVENQKQLYNKISLYPEIQRDLTIEVNKDVSYEEIKSLFENIKYLKDIRLMEVYTGENISSNKKSITLRITFQNKEDTLQNSQIDEQLEIVFERCDKKGFVINGR